MQKATHRRRAMTNEELEAAHETGFDYHIKRDQDALSFSGNTLARLVSPIMTNVIIAKLQNCNFKTLQFQVLIQTIPI